jgi:hypothetical protein
MPGREDRCQRVWAGQPILRTMSVVVRAMCRLDARVHGHIADSVGATDASRGRFPSSSAMWNVVEERSVKPSAQPTLVRTQHLPHPGETARSLRKRGPAGRFLLVTMCISVCHCGSMHSSGCVHMVYSVYRFKTVVRGLSCRFSGSALCRSVVLVDDAAEDLAALYRRVQAHDGHLVMVGWPLLAGLVRTVPVVAAPRGAVLYRPRSGQG